MTERGVGVGVEKVTEPHWQETCILLAGLLPVGGLRLRGEILRLACVECHDLMTFM